MVKQFSTRDCIILSNNERYHIHMKVWGTDSGPLQGETPKRIERRKV